MKLKLDENLSRHLNLRKYPPGTHPGIIVFRPSSYGPLTVNKFVTDFARSANLEALASCVAIVDPTRIRVRSPEVDR